LQIIGGISLCSGKTPYVRLPFTMARHRSLNASVQITHVRCAMFFPILLARLTAVDSLRGPYLKGRHDEMKP
jgi:hypothetical protein